MLRCTKWLPDVKIEKSCQTISGQPTGRVFTKLQRSSVPSLVHITACSVLLHKMAVRAMNRKILSSFHRSSYWWDFNGISHKLSLPSLDLHIASTLPIHNFGRSRVFVTKNPSISK
jgi:hypothetical protein